MSEPFELKIRNPQLIAFPQIQWQPIETAPKDGSHILAFGRRADLLARIAGREMPPMTAVIHWSWHDTEELEEVGEGLFRKVPKRALETWEPYGPHFFEPTHWMPLPAPPSA